MNEEIFNINGKYLDEEQRQVVVSTNKNILVVAAAGSGKSLTIVGKIKYLIEINKIKESEILCISFTNDSCLSLKSKLKLCNYDIDVLTFHKLSLKILKDHNMMVNISNSDTLEYLIDEYFNSYLQYDKTYLNIVIKYLKVNYLFLSDEKKYNKLISEKYKEIECLKKLLSTFIHLFKSGKYDYNYLINIYKSKNNIFNKSDILFLSLVFKIIYEYEKELMSYSCVDFDDMISYSTNVLKNSKKKYNYKYIIIDEFQDTSLVRYNLINELINKCNCSFMAVGDDYQSIYRFTGCDLSIFLNFKNAIVYKIQTTYRNSYELIKASEKFIKKNKSQIDKVLISNKRINKPIKIIYYTNQKYEFIKLLNEMYKKGFKNILILGRNNNEIYKVIDCKFTLKKDGELIYEKYKDMNLRFLTIHKSKGLEEENVIILSMEDNLWGFPNKKSDDKILKYVLPKKEKYLYSEERRLFYVALTRTKNNVYLLVNKYNPSIFVKEIIRDSKKYIEIK